MTLKEFIANPPEQPYVWIAKQLARVKISDSFLGTEVEYAQPVARDMKSRGVVEFVKVGDSFNIYVGGGYGKVNGEKLRWGEAYKRMRDILSAKTAAKSAKTANAPMQRETRTPKEIQAAIPVQLRTSWTDYDFLDKINAQVCEETVAWWNKKHPGMY